MDRASSAILAAQTRRPWQRALPAFALVLVAIAVAYAETLFSMVAIWASSNTFAHAFLVPPIVSWLIWRRRRELALLEPRPCPWMLGPMAAIAVAWLIGDLVAVNAVTQLAMTTLLVLAVPGILGLRVARTIAFPLAFAFFAVPIGEFLLPQLMSWTADFTVIALRASGIPVFREGQQFVIPSGRWAVVEACSGIRYLIASFMVGTLFACLHYRSIRRRLAFIAVSIAVPVVANWVRAYLIVLLGHVSGNRLAVGVDHLIYGWLFFGIVMGIMFTIGFLWREPDAEAEGNIAANARPWAAPSRSRLEPVWLTAAAAIVLAVSPHLALGALGESGTSAPVRLTAFGDLPGGWAASARPPAWQPRFQNPSAEAETAFVNADRLVGLYVAYYRRQDYDRKLVSSSNELVRSDDRRWVQTEAIGSETLALDDGVTLTVRSFVFREVSPSGAAELNFRAWQLYWVGDQLTSSDLRAKFYAAFDRLAGRGDDAAAIVIHASDEPQGSGRAVLQSFLRANLGTVVTKLRAARDSARANAGGSGR